MFDKTADKAEAVNWAAYTGSLPKQGVVYPEGQERKELAERMRAAFAKKGVRQTA